MVSKLGARWARCTMLVVIAMLSLVHLDCGEKDKQPPSTETTPATPASASSATGAGTLVIEDNSLASWIAINNNFAKPSDAEMDPAKQYYWAGLLVQVGDYPVPPSARKPRTFQQLVLSKSGNPDTAIARDPAKRFWINIVSRPDSIQAEPMLAKHAESLYPSGYTSGPCSALTVDAKCLRGQKIHSQMNPVLGIVTYWQGLNGYTIAAKQTTIGSNTRFDLTLLDDFKVEIYDITGSAPISRKTYDYGQIDQITISAVPPGPSDGDKIDPPWPGK